jgi:hypothetical protein
MIEHGNALSRNPNICASCSSLVDGILDADPAALREAAGEERRAAPNTRDPIESWLAR